MKIKIKNLQQKTYEVEIDPARTVLDLKEEIFRQLGVPYNIESQTLIYAGTILQDTQPINHYNVDENKFIVCLVKVKTVSAPASPPPPADQPTSSSEYIATIMELGFSESQAREALAASMNDPDRAVDFLISGEVPQEIIPNDGNNNVSEAFEFLRSQPQFAQMRNLVRQHPELLQEVLRRIGRSNPSLMTMISENQEAFMEMLNRDDDTEDPNTLTIEVTQEDKDAIDRLKALGFPEDLVIQAYFACDKNENMAANFLLASTLTDD
ncbi:RAD23B family protein [Megaselia abdita]